MEQEERKQQSVPPSEERKQRSIVPLEERIQQSVPPSEERKQRSIVPLEERIQRSIDLFMQGYGCSQSVVAAFSDLYGMDEQMALRVAAGFGGGVGRMRMMCGAVSGIVTLVGLQWGQTEGSDKEGKAHCYKVVQQLLAEFQERNGSIICAELLKLNGCKAVTDTHIPDDRNAEYYRKRPCVRKVESAARIFAEYLASLP